MGTNHFSKKEFPSVVDSAYEQYKRDLSRYKLVSDIMTREVVTTTPEASMQDAAWLMGSKHIGSLIVKKYDTPVGIVTERDLLTKVIAKGKDLKQEKVEDVMSYPLHSISLDAQIKEAAQMMIKEKARLGVFKDATLMGIITASDLIRSLPEIDETAVSVSDFMSKPVVTTDEATSVKTVSMMMGEQRIGSVVVTRKNRPAAIFTERDLLTTFLAGERSLETNVGSRASSPLITIPAKTSVHKAAATMATKRIRRLPLVEEDSLVGIVTARDLVEAYAK